MMDQKKSLRKKIKEIEDKFEEISTSVSEVKEIADKIENQSIESNFKDINTLSDFARCIIEVVKGPLKLDNIFQFLMNDVLGKKYDKILPYIRRYSDDVDGVMKQLSEILQKIKEHMELTNEQEEMDIEFMITIKEVIKAIEEEKNSDLLQLNSNNSLSLFAQNVIYAVKGPMKPDNIFQFLKNDVLNIQHNGILPSIRRYSDDVDAVMDQMSKVIHKIEEHMEYTKKQREMDIELVKKIMEVIKAIEEEKESSKTQPSVDKALIFKIPQVRYNINKNTRIISEQNPPASSIHGTQTEEHGRKRKSNDKTRIFTGSENRIAVTGCKIDECLKINLDENNIASSFLEKSDDYDHERTEVMSEADSEESSSHSDELMSIGSSEGNLSDAMSVDESIKNDFNTVSNLNIMHYRHNYRSPYPNARRRINQSEISEDEKVFKRAILQRGRRFR